MFVHCIDPYSCCGQSDEVDVRIIDFGLAVKCGDNSVRELRGTLEYMGGEDHTSRKTVRAARSAPANATRCFYHCNSAVWLYSGRVRCGPHSSRYGVWNSSRNGNPLQPSQS
jgi:hypothetical protein